MTTAYAADPSLTLSAARDLYFEVNHFGADGGYGDAWVAFELGPIPMPFPNTKARVRAVRFHDLHHVLTGYATDTVGELEISAWELASGCADHWAAWQLNLAGTLAGAVAAPRRTWRAFLRGRRSDNLYRASYDDALLGRTVREAREAARLDRDPGPARASDVALFAACLVVGLLAVASFVPIMLPAAIVTNVAALFRRKARPEAAAC